MDPLRKILSSSTEYIKRGMFSYPRYYEYLECGHRVTQRSDIYGPTNAKSRRCRECGLTPRAADVKPRRADKVKSRKVSRG